MNVGEIKPKILIHAYGNPGRGDDGIGSAFVQMCQPWLSHESVHHLTIESSYQLSVEDAYTMSEFDIVVFVDATMENIENFTFTAVQQKQQSPFTTHAMSPSGALYLCKELYGKQPETYLLQIGGYEWEMLEGLSEQAEKNLWKAFHFFRAKLEEWIELEHYHEDEHEHS
ncbi:MAG: hydrogenase maturation protease [Bacteriovoracaceae bacterium]|nr:hydrogenase maturation protease [Bacteroidota bacterium]